MYRRLACVAMVSLVATFAQQARAEADAQAPRGAACRKACDAAFEAGTNVCRKIKNRRFRERCWAEAERIYSICLKACPSGTRDTLDDEDDGAMTPGCEPSRSDD